MVSPSVLQLCRQGSCSDLCARCPGLPSPSILPVSPLPDARKAISSLMGAPRLSSSMAIEMEGAAARLAASAHHAPHFPQSPLTELIPVASKRPLSHDTFALQPYQYACKRCVDQENTIGHRSCSGGAGAVPGSASLDRLLGVPTPAGRKLCSQAPPRPQQESSRRS